MNRAPDIISDGCFLSYLRSNDLQRLHATCAQVVRILHRNDVIWRRRFCVGQGTDRVSFGPLRSLRINPNVSARIRRGNQANRAAGDKMEENSLRARRWGGTRWYNLSHHEFRSAPGSVHVGHVAFGDK
jgi:hypothetical protein